MLLDAEKSSLLAVTGVCLGLAAAFPFDALVSRVGSAPARAPVAPVAFVELDAATEVALVRAAKDSWRKGSGLGRIYADLALSDLPEEQPTPVLAVTSRSRPPALAPVSRETPPYLPSCKAAPPPPLPETARPEELPFSRAELLKIN